MKTKSITIIGLVLISLVCTFDHRGFNTAVGAENPAKLRPHRLGHDSQQIIQLDPQQGTTVWGWQDDSGYIWQAPSQKGQPQTPQLRGFQDGPGNQIFIFPHPPANAPPQ